MLPKEGDEAMGALKTQTPHNKTLMIKPDKTVMSVDLSSPDANDIIAKNNLQPVPVQQATILSTAPEKRLSGTGTEGILKTTDGRFFERVEMPDGSMRLHEVSSEYAQKKDIALTKEKRPKKAFEQIKEMANPTVSPTYKEGDTATGDQGQKIIFKGGKWQIK